MNRIEFEALRDHGDKQIVEDIRFSKPKATHPVWIAENIPITSSSGQDLRLTVSFNPESGASKFNVHIPGVGPICRLEVGGPAHRPAGRSHKHALHTERCPDTNLPQDVVDRPELLGQPFADLFAEFCTLARIEHLGSLELPEE